jgi:hypothetical protein
MQEHVTLLGPAGSPRERKSLSSTLPPDLMEQVRGRVRLLALLLLIAIHGPRSTLKHGGPCISRQDAIYRPQHPLRGKQVAMESQKAVIERSNRKSIEKVDVQVTVTSSGSGRQSWRGEFMSRTADGFLPSERIWLTLDNGQKGMASISETHFNSRTPDATLIQFIGKGPLA